MNADVIISICAPTRACYVTAEIALRTLAAHTDANLIAVANNMPVLEFKEALFANAKSLGVKWHWYEKAPLNIANLFNESFRATSGKYYVGGQQDVIFYPRWLDNLIEAWESEPNYFVLAPYTFNLWRNDLTCTLPGNPRSGILELWPHSVAALAFRRDKPWYYDENIPGECDSDLYQHCHRNKLRTGIVMNSRVDHLGQVTASEIGGVEKIMENPTQCSEDARKLKEKWNL
jgi:hypothetical protein